ncbi:mite allergen Der p 3-like [Leptopilina boulardi]|uniref:mite allergen Der p 3-like n=1 Tax=Leptopilina boulardi TaxID=63433 RepID=UPI0021F62B30|nr:mite allergen Der p 3-like [Leptopilina boulardi]
MCQMMFSVIFFSLILLQVDGTQLSTKIINGINVKSGIYSFMVSIQDDKEHICGGAILNKYYILTAAHCFESYKINEIQIKAGSTNLNGLKSHKVDKIIVHKKYSSTTGEYDIALVRLKKPFSSNDNLIQFVKLPKFDNDPKVNQTVFVAGWGRTIDKEISNELMKINLIVADQKNCMEIFEDEFLYFKITNRNFCIRSPSGIHGPCIRDSGGPVVSFKKEKGKKIPIILGIISWSDTNYCGYPEYPDVVTKVSKYLNWIKVKSNV